MLDLLWLVPALPLAGALALLAGALRFGKRTTTAIGVGSAGLTLAAVAAILVQYAGMHGETVARHVFNWISAGDVTVDFALRLDPLSAVMLSFVTLVGFVIHVYSIGYMHTEGDRAYARFFAYLNLFMFAMLTLVLGANLVVMFIGWEGVGLCSYLLIGFYFDKEYCAAAGIKAFVVNRIGDFGFLLAIFWAFKVFGTVDFAGMATALAADPGRYAAAVTPIALLLFVGAIGKSAQLPLYVWLPDAMAGPTPVSALIHAATMVTAGVYMVVRCNFIYRLSPTAMLVVAAVGGVTAIFAATIGLAQNDIKKVLAYSTVSQLGYMFLAAGAGAFAGGIFHVFTHAFFKACLFLGAGSVIHACSGEQDMRRMGGLAKKIPVTYWTFMVATLALCGIPPFAGFFSKDEILGRVFAAGAGNLNGFGASYLVLWALGLAAAFLTAFYMFRAVYMTFHGEFRGTPEQWHHVHESPGTMTWPLKILAAGSALVGLLGVGTAITFGTDLNWFESFLHRVAPTVEVEHAPALATEWVLILLSVAVALAGILLARRFYSGAEAFAAPQRMAERAPAVYAAVANKYYVDEAYDRAVVRPLGKLARFSWKGIDTIAIDGTLNASAFFTEIAGDLLRFLQTGNVRNYALFVLCGALAAAAWLLL
ncbi:MAG: NADH-quinone oxidoreductase subunit L [Acidobacteria bacterium]|nr:MAG: NADH-quinone oxidoreductase subunit L [Acidobacteriota bacterium]